MRLLKQIRNPFLIFLPFLVVYIVLVLAYPTTGTFGDENRYLIYGRYMIDGFLPANELNFDHLGNGPGYSMLLVPFIALHIPIIWMAILNAFLYYFSIILLVKAALKLVSFRAAIVIGFFWACYINSYTYLSKILPEILTLFLVCLLIFYLVDAFDKTKSKKNIYLAGIIMGYLALVKPIFGYVLLCMLAVALIIWFINRKLNATSYKNSVVILMIALATTLPYLIYTFSVTGKVFYWSSYGGTNLYWMTLTDENEYGSWFPSPGDSIDAATQHMNLKNFQEQIKIKHGQDFEEINKYSGVAQDDVYKKMAMRNIETHPGKFLQNCFSNVGRLVFNLPYSYKLQTPYTLIRLPFNGIIVLLMLLCLLPTIKNWRKIKFSIRFMLMISLLYFGGSILGSAETRMFTVIIPFLLCYTAYVFKKTYNINVILN